MSTGFVGRSPRGAFALGLTVGAVLATAAFAWLERDSSQSRFAGDATLDGNATLPQWHRGAASGDVASAVRVSMQFLGAPGEPSPTLAPAGAAVTDRGSGAMLARAEEHRRKREFRQACELYAAVAKDGAMTADAWADFADAQASLAGHIAGEPARAIAAALALEPRHPKALWLKASLAHEEGRYADALATWKLLLAVVPADSSDARIVEANIAEASRLAAG